MSRSESLLVWVATLLVTVSGLGFGAFKYFARSEDPFAVVHHPLQTFFLKMHVLAAPLLVFALGIVVARHAWSQWTSGSSRGRRSGIVLVMTLAPMIVTGYLVQTLVSRRAVTAAVVAHWAFGIAYLAVFGVHQVRAWAAKRACQRRDVRVLTRRAS